MEKGIGEEGQGIGGSSGRVENRWRVADVAGNEQGMDFGI